MGLDAQVPVSVLGLPIVGDVQAAIILPLKNGVEEGEATIVLPLNGELDGWPHTV